MRKSVLILLVCLLAVPALGSATLLRKNGDGTLSVQDGRGRVVVAVRGAVIGRFDRGSVTIYDRTPRDAFTPRVWGALPAFQIGLNGERHQGENVRFRLLGGEFILVVRGSGIALSAVGTGSVTLEGWGRAPGVYSLDGEDCSAPRARCPVLPDPAKTFRLGTDPDERGSSRPSG
ncbi:MAG TPA: hypothetical protein VFO81_13890 [Gaiellaceae bacterium]|nr:hypothetical protein [Gaiellaceae bacterium]